MTPGQITSIEQGPTYKGGPAELSGDVNITDDFGVIPRDVGSAASKLAEIDTQYIDETLRQIEEGPRPINDDLTHAQASPNRVITRDGRRVILD